MAFINYTGKNVLGIGLGSGEIVRLMPGINEVNENELNEMKAHPLFQSRLKMEIIKILDNSKDGKRPSDEMLNNIPQIFDTKLLRKIIANDERKDVVKAAEEQLDKIKNPEKWKEEKNNDHFV